MKTVVFDKTGTLTVGRPEVVSVVLFSTFPMEVLCDVAIAVEVSAQFWLNTKDLCTWNSFLLKNAQSKY